MHTPAFVLAIGPPISPKLAAHPPMLDMGRKPSPAASRCSLTSKRLVTFVGQGLLRGDRVPYHRLAPFWPIRRCDDHAYQDRPG